MEIFSFYADVDVHPCVTRFLTFHSDALLRFGSAADEDLMPFKDKKQNAERHLLGTVMIQELHSRRWQWIELL